jgi:magnesium transporter
MNPYSRLGAAFLRDHPAEAAHVLEDFPAESVAQLLTATNQATTEHLFEHFTPVFAASCLAVLEPEAASRLFPQLPFDSRLPVLRQLERDKRESLLNGLEPNLAASLRRLLPYPAGTAGSLMETSLTTVSEELSVRNALKRIKRIQRGIKSHVYVTNASGQLTGVLSLHELINSPAGRAVNQVMHRHVLSLSPEQSLQSVANSPYWQEYHALPVTDENNILLGVIRQKGLRRFQERSLQVDAVSSGLGTLVSVGELFAVTAGHLVSALISTGTSLTGRGRHG